MRFRLIRSSIPISSLAVGWLCASFAHAQIVPGDLPPAPKPRPTVELPAARQIPEPPPNLPQISREQRAQSYAKLLEGQRYLWTLQNSRSRAGAAANGRSARAALIKAVELNPGFAEAYTALAELSSITGASVAEIERAANFAVRLDADNYGARRLLARIYTSQSDLGAENADRTAIDKAVVQWREIARLDPRNAEAWAFLAEFYGRTGQTEKQLDALGKWRGASATADERFYRSITGKPGLSADAAAVELGRALLNNNRTAEAIRVLTDAASQNPDEAIVAALRQAIENAQPNEAASAINALQTAVLANPGNTVLLELLTDTLARAGRIEDAARNLRQASERFAASDNQAAARALAKLGALYVQVGRDADAIAAFENALKTMNIGSAPLAAEAEREFAQTIVPQLVGAYRNAGQSAKAVETIKRLGALLGNSDPSADLQLIELLRASNEREAALKAARAARLRFPEDANLLRIEAEVLTDAGKVDEAVTLLRARIVNKSKQVGVPSALVNDFLAHLTIANLYTQTNRGEDAINAARQALDLSQNSQMTNIALLTLATAENAAGDFKAAETSLRQVLKQEPNNATALNNLGYFLIERGERFPEAVELIKRAIEREPTNASFLDSLGWAYFRSNQLAEAEKYLTEAARRNPNSAEIQHHLGDLYERQNKPEQAAATWRKALNLAKSPAEIARIKAKLSTKK